MKKILHIEGCNFENFPLGGTLSFAKQFIENIKGSFYLVGFGDEKDPIGVWFKKTINGKEYNYFSIGSTTVVSKSRLPKRIVSYNLLRKYIYKIHKDVSYYDIVFTQTPQFVFLISKYKWKKNIFCFAGLGNSVGNSKYKYLRFFGGMYETLLFKKLKNKYDLVLAAANQETILKKEKVFKMGDKKIISFPTRFNPNIFYPRHIDKAREELNIDKDINLIVAVGRLSSIKGWKDIIKAYRIFLHTHPNSQLIFVGDGEDKEEIQSFAKTEIKIGTIVLIGKKHPKEISTFLSAANIFVMFSFIEGWPTSMTEALACGKNIVTSDVSGAKEMISLGVNGFIVKHRNVEEFAYSMRKALEFPTPNNVSTEISKRYSSEKLNDDFNAILKL